MKHKRILQNPNYTKDHRRELRKVLREKNPDPHFKQNHHQWLKEFGRQKVNDQIQRVVTIMKLCDDMDDFREKFNRVFKKALVTSQMSFDFGGNG